MSRPSQLPPRCPLKKNVGARQALELNSIYTRGVNKSSTRHHRSLSQSSIFEDQQPSWVDDLLSDSDSVPKVTHHYRSASDSVALLDGVVPNLFDEDCVKASNVLESDCLYGPNSPRRRSNIDFSDSTVLYSLSDYVNRSPMQYVEDIPRSCGNSRFNLKEDYCDAPYEITSEAKSGKRHPGQRSRARKLQYIAELERTVDVFQLSSTLPRQLVMTMESELASRVSSLLQQKVVLSLENNKLKQQMAMLQQQKLIMDGEYHNLKKEADSLKLGLTNSTTSKICAYGASNDSNSPEITWQILDCTPSVAIYLLHCKSDRVFKQKNKTCRDHYFLQ